MAFVEWLFPSASILSSSAKLDQTPAKRRTDGWTGAAGGLAEGTGVRWTSLFWHADAATIPTSRLIRPSSDLRLAAIDRSTQARMRSDPKYRSVVASAHCTANAVVPTDTFSPNEVNLNERNPLNDPDHPLITESECYIRKSTKNLIRIHPDFEPVCV